MSGLEEIIAREVLHNPLNREWSVQGLGMLRTYLDSEHVFRLHIWDSQFRIPDVSPIHDHPWDMESIVVFGRLHQFRYTELFAGDSSKNFEVAYIKCGANAEVLSRGQVTLSRGVLETYIAGQSYAQRAEEIHESRPEDGTVTIVKRVVPEGRSRDHARVFWKSWVSRDFVSAEPRKATPYEVLSVLDGVTRWMPESW